MNHHPYKNTKKQITIICTQPGKKKKEATNSVTIEDNGCSPDKDTNGIGQVY